jgi:Flp pilus assembly protein TadG
VNHSSRTSALRGQDGQALIEYALVLPLLLLLIFGVLEFGRGIHYWIDSTHLANEGARYAAVNRNPGPGGTLAQTLANKGSTSELRDGSGSVDPLQICIDYPNGTSAVGDPVRVRATTTYTFIPFMNLLPVAITGEATMRIERRPDTSIAGCAS